MNTVEDALRLVLPLGTRGERTWNKHPEWPPDLFGVTAYLLEQTGAYAWLRPRSTTSLFGLDETSQGELCEAGLSWRRGEWLLKGRRGRGAARRSEKLVGRLWSTLWSCRGSQLIREVRSSRVPEWAVAALHLLIVADEASAGIGFFPSRDEESLPYIPVVALNNFFFPTGRKELSRAPQRHPNSIGWFLDAQVACVLPKTRTPTVGCTIRSLSHHLCLLGSIGEVKARWHVNPVLESKPANEGLGGAPQVFNLLLIPFPYRIAGRSFANSQASEYWGLFDLEQTWLPQKQGRGDTQAFCRFALDLVTSAEREVGCIHGIILPELSLNVRCYQALLRTVRAKLPKLRFLIAGVLESKNGENRNVVRVTALYPGSVFGSRGGRMVQVAQSKHHRWKLEAQQIHRYSLGDALDPNRYWWENIDVHERELNFFVFGSGSCFTTLICEDLARVDPGQRVLRAVGPNIVFALLMDGPQLVSRWPGRSCSVLAEDPGSSVLTLTSLGLVERSSIAVRSSSRCIALWKDPTGYTQELDLPSGSHALCVTLSGRRVTEYTLDGREDGGAALYWSLSGAMPLRLTRPPDWV